MKTRVVPADSESGLDEALACLRRGGLVGLPTETVYGLAADATNGLAVARVFEAKGRPRFNPLICHVENFDAARRIACFDAASQALAAAFWPGPLTIVAPRAEDAVVHPLACGGLPTIAVRAPQGIAAGILTRLGRPLAAPSANPSGRVSATSADLVLRGLGGRIDMILDAGPCQVGLESTIVKVERDRLVLLRAGPVGRAELAAASGLPVVDRGSGAAIEAPGQLRSHYAPAAAVRLNVRRVEIEECFIDFGGQAIEGAAAAREVFDLSPGGDLREAAANLFAALSRFDRADVKMIAVAPIPADGLGEAINDRLARAAAPRN